MIKNQLISVVIPTYKRPGLLGRAIDSVLNQTYKNIEIIIVDDNDEDSEYRKQTEEYIRKYSNHDKIRYIQHEINQGACVARNTGANIARGEYLAFLDDDDVWLKTKLEKQVELFVESEDIALVLCNYKFKDGSNATNFNLNNNAFIDLLKRGKGITTSTFLIKKDVFKKANGFDSALPSSQDYDLLLRISKDYKIKCTKEILVFYDEVTQGITNNSESKLLGKEIIIKKYKKYYINYNLERYIYRHYEKASHYAILSNEKKKAINYMKLAFESNKSFKRLFKLLLLYFSNKKIYLKIIKFKNLIKGLNS